jgi:hypothetical protein
MLSRWIAAEMSGIDELYAGHPSGAFPFLDPRDRAGSRGYLELATSGWQVDLRERALRDEDLMDRFVWMELLLRQWTFGGEGCGGGGFRIVALVPSRAFPPELPTVPSTSSHSQRSCISLQFRIPPLATESWRVLCRWPHCNAP